MADKKMLEKQPFKDKLAIIMGGSQGIGKAIAKEIAQLGGNICIIARTVETLKNAVKEIESVKANDDQKINMISCDATDMDKLKPLIDDFIKDHGIPYYLINSIGQAYPNYIQKMTPDDYRKAMEINFMGMVVPVLCLLPHLIEKSTKIQEEVGVDEWKNNWYGHIVNISSEAGFLGLMGYTTYCPTKFAMVGFSECIRNELKPYHIRISVVYPIDTKTPGYELENKTKPEELKTITAIAGLMEPDVVAEKIVKKFLKNKFNIFLGSAGFHNWAKRHLPWFAFSELDKELRNARKKLGKNIKY